MPGIRRDPPPEADEQGTVPPDMPLAPPSTLLLPRDDGSMKWPKERAEAFLASQPLVPVFIPLASYEEHLPGPIVKAFYWNGWGWPVTKGRQEMVPYPIAEIIWMWMSPGVTQQYHDRRPWNCLITPGTTQTVRGETFGGLRLEV